MTKKSYPTASTPKLYRGARKLRLQIFGTKPGVLRDAGEQTWSNFFALMKGEHRIRPSFPRKNLMRACLSFNHPTNTNQRGQYSARFH